MYFDAKPPKWTSSNLHVLSQHLYSPRSKRVGDRHDARRVPDVPEPDGRGEDDDADEQLDLPLAQLDPAPNPFPELVQRAPRSGTVGIGPPLLALCPHPGLFAVEPALCQLERGPGAEGGGGVEVGSGGGFGDAVGVEIGRRGRRGGRVGLLVERLGGQRTSRADGLGHDAGASRGRAGRPRRRVFVDGWSFCASRGSDETTATRRRPATTCAGRAGPPSSKRGAGPERDRGRRQHAPPARNSSRSGWCCCC